MSEKTFAKSLGCTKVKKIWFYTIGNPELLEAKFTLAKLRWYGNCVLRDGKPREGHHAGRSSGRRRGHPRQRRLETLAEDSRLSLAASTALLQGPSGMVLAHTQSQQKKSMLIRRQSRDNDEIGGNDKDCQIR